MVVFQRNWQRDADPTYYHHCESLLIESLEDAMVLNHQVAVEYLLRRRWLYIYIGTTFRGSFSLHLASANCAAWSR